MDSTAVDRIAQLGIDSQKANRIETFTPAIILNAGNGTQRVVSMEPFDEHRTRFRGTFDTSSLNDFAQYVIARTNGEGFIDTAAMRAEVFFNLNISEGTGPKLAGHADHRARLTLVPTAAFVAMQNATCEANHRTKTEAAQFSQKSLVEWLEDWSDNLAADYPDATDNSPNDPTRMRQALTALRKVKIKATGESVHTDRDFGASRSALEDIEASSDVGLPRGFRFTCVSHEGLPTTVFYLRLGVHPDPENPRFTLRWPRREADIEQIGQDFKTAILNAIGDKATMLLGTFDPGK